MRHPPLSALAVPASYTRLLLQQWPARMPALLRHTGLRPADLAGRETISAAQQLEVLRNAARIAGHPGWAVEFGAALSLASHGPLGFAAVSAATLGEGLEVLAEFAPIRAPFFGFALEQVGQQLRLRVDAGRYDLGDLELPIIEIVLQVARAYVDAVCGAGAVDTTLYVARPRPAHAKSYVTGGRLTCVFDAVFHGVAVPASVRGLPCPLHDEKTYRAALLRCHEALDAVLNPDDVVARSSHWLAAHFDEVVAGRAAPRQPRLEDLAGVLCVSPRTLVRRLADSSTSFTALRVAQQYRIACRLLGDARFTAGEIGVLLGYDDEANFARAFKRKAGVPPGQYRRRSGQAAGHGTSFD
jgi:AraC-like DNA-binding protein